MRVDLGSRQYIELNTGEVNDGSSFGYQYDIVLNSFQTAGNDDGYGAEEDAYEAGAVALYSCIQNHIDKSTQKMSELDMELVVKFFNEVNK